MTLKILRGFSVGSGHKTLGQESLEFIRTSSHVKNVISFVQVIHHIHSPLMVYTRKVQIPSHLSFMMCSILKVVNTPGRKKFFWVVLVSAVGGGGSTIRNDIAKYRNSGALI